MWFFLFPGRHLFGDANVAHYGPHYIMDHPVIFITAAYRLGPFGKISLDSKLEADFDFLTAKNKQFFIGI